MHILEELRPHFVVVIGRDHPEDAGHKPLQEVLVYPRSLLPAEMLRWKQLRSHESPALSPHANGLGKL